MPDSTDFIKLRVLEDELTHYHLVKESRNNAVTHTEEYLSERIQELKTEVKS